LTVMAAGAPTRMLLSVRAVISDAGVGSSGRCGFVAVPGIPGGSMGGCGPIGVVPGEFAGIVPVPGLGFEIVFVPGSVAELGCVAPTWPAVPGVAVPVRLEFAPAVVPGVVEALDVPTVVPTPLVAFADTAGVVPTAPPVAFADTSSGVVD
jgi:hypothetical protein